MCAFSREWLVCFSRMFPTEALLMRPDHTPQDGLFVQPMTAAQVPYFS